MPHPPESSSAQSEQPVRGPLSCGTSNRITQNSLCIPKAQLRWEYIVSSEACLQGSLIFHLLLSPLQSLFLPLPLCDLSACLSPAKFGMYPFSICFCVALCVFASGLLSFCFPLQYLSPTLLDPPREGVCWDLCACFVALSN